MALQVSSARQAHQLDSSSDDEQSVQRGSSREQDSDDEMEDYEEDIAEEEIIGSGPSAPSKPGQPPARVAVKPKRTRTTFTKAEKKRVEEVLKASWYPSNEAVEALAAEMKKPVKPVRKLLDNTRLSLKKAGATEGTEPKPEQPKVILKVTVPPTAVARPAPTTASAKLVLPVAKPVPIQTAQISKIKRETDVFSPITPDQGGVRSDSEESNSGPDPAMADLVANLKNDKVPLSKDKLSVLRHLMKQSGKDKDSFGGDDVKRLILRRAASASSSFLVAFSKDAEVIKVLKKWAYAAVESEEIPTIQGLLDLWPKLELDLEILKESNFGKVVKKLGKNKDKSIASRAEAIMKLWKEKYLDSQASEPSPTAKESKDEKAPATLKKESALAESKSNQMKPKSEDKPKVDAIKPKPEAKSKPDEKKPAAGPAKAPAPPPQPQKMARDNFDVFRDLLDPMEQKTKAKRIESSVSAEAKAKEEAEALRLQQVESEQIAMQVQEPVQSLFENQMMMPPFGGSSMEDLMFGQDATTPPDYFSGMKREGNLDDREDPAKRVRLATPLDGTGRPVAGILRKGTRKGLRVRWAPDSALVQIREFELDESEINRERHFKTARDMDVAEAGHLRELKSNQMQPTMAWPAILPLIALPNWEDGMVAVPGAESLEREVQTRREQATLYLSGIASKGPSPSEPDHVSFTEIEPKPIRLDSLSNKGPEPILAPVSFAPQISMAISTPGYQATPSYQATPTYQATPSYQPQMAVPAQGGGIYQQQQYGFAQQGFGQQQQDQQQTAYGQPYGQTSYLQQQQQQQQTASFAASAVPANLAEIANRISQSLPAGYAGQTGSTITNYGYGGVSQAQSATMPSQSHPDPSPWGSSWGGGSPPSAPDRSDSNSSQRGGGAGGGSNRGGFNKPGIRPGGGYERPGKCKFFLNGNCMKNGNCWNLHTDRQGNIVEETYGSRQVEAERSS